MELDVERTAERVQVLVHAEGLAHPLAHELLLEHDGLGRVHDGGGGEDGVVALDASGHGEFNIIDTSLTSGQSCLISASTRSELKCLQGINEKTRQALSVIARTLHRQDPQTMGHGILQTTSYPFSGQIQCRS